jgi:hypothetical protein
VLIPINQRLKLGAQSHPGIYLGLSSKHTMYHRLLMDNTKAIIVTWDIVFQEYVMPNKLCSSLPALYRLLVWRHTVTPVPPIALTASSCH